MKANWGSGGIGGRKWQEAEEDYILRRFIA
jgi:hypothetical protein